LGCNNNEITYPEKQKTLVLREKIFYSSGPDDHINIYMMDKDGSNVEQITHYIRGEYRGAKILPDKKTILYYRLDENTGANGIFIKKIYDPDPENPIDYGFGCDFTPDGNSIIYTKHIYNSSGGFDAIYRFNLTDLSKKQITADGILNWTPSISPDGNKIVFVTWRKLSPNDTITFSRWDIMTMNIDGSNEEYILPPQNGQWSSCPSYSNDNQSIVFSTNSMVRIFNIKNRTVLNITQMTNSINELHPSFSLDDKKIYFDAGGWHSSSIYELDISGSSLIKLTNNANINRHPYVSQVYVYE